MVLVPAATDSAVTVAYAQPVYVHLEQLLHSLRQSCVLYHHAVQTVSNPASQPYYTSLARALRLDSTSEFQSLLKSDISSSDGSSEPRTKALNNLAVTLQVAAVAFDTVFVHGGSAGPSNSELSVSVLALNLVIAVVDCTADAGDGLPQSALASLQRLVNLCCQNSIWSLNQVQTVVKAFAAVLFKHIGTALGAQTAAVLQLSPDKRSAAAVPWLLIEAVLRSCQSLLSRAIDASQQASIVTDETAKLLTCCYWFQYTVSAETETVTEAGMYELRQHQFQPVGLSFSHHCNCGHCCDLYTTSG